MRLNNRRPDLVQQLRAAARPCRLRKRVVLRSGVLSGLELIDPWIAGVACSDPSPIRIVSQEMGNATIRLFLNLGDNTEKVTLSTITGDAHGKLIRLAGGDPLVRAVGLAIDDERTGSADAFAAIVIESDRFLAALGEFLVDDIQGLVLLLMFMRQGVLEPNVAFLAKPFSPETLTRTVREVLNDQVRPRVET